MIHYAIIYTAIFSLPLLPPPFCTHAYILPSFTMLQYTIHYNMAPGRHLWLPAILSILRYHRITYHHHVNQSTGDV